MTRHLTTVTVVVLVLGGHAVYAKDTATHSVSGQVVDARTKEPISDARVAIVSSHLVFTTTTDESGAYDFPAIPGGSFAFSVHARAYDSHRRQISVASTQRQDALLNERSFMLQFGSRTGLDLTLIQPGSYVYFDSGTDDPGEVDFFKDGKLSLSVQLVGIDAVLWTDASGGTRFGVNLGTGISAAQGDDVNASNQSTSASAVMWSFSGFVDLNNFARLEYGRIQGFSAKEGLSSSQKSDAALYFGISLKTSLGNELVKILR